MRFVTKTFRATWIIVKIIFDALLCTFLSLINFGILNNNRVFYYFHGESFVFRINKKRGPKTVKDVFDECGKSVYTNVKKYMGPYEDFHQLKYSPWELGYGQLRFLCIGNGFDYEKIFQQDQIINLE